MNIEFEIINFNIYMNIESNYNTAVKSAVDTAAVQFTHYSVLTKVVRSTAVLAPLSTITHQDR